ncbi:hypothetical protein J5N97_001419 [Dioscorea zingiberensis]|uniref:Uncharacterized protein n=1 Tax=Dioscorea zingiberensis TaxID=325984 RepID=A0A9D5H2D3_9LILI|nr:hypothetical protein J5N97_001419 [Dioscorea zingiberensis]
MSILEAELEETIQEMEAAEESTLASLTKEKSGLDLDAAALIKSLSLKSPKNGVAKPVLEVAKYRETCAMHEPQMQSPPHYSTTPVKNF